MNYGNTWIAVFRGVKALHFSARLWWIVCLAPGFLAYGQPGSLDRTFSPGSASDGPVYALALQDDGKLLIAGDFSIADCEVRNRVARLKSDGTLDAGFGAGQQGANGLVRAVAVQEDGKVLIGGDFTLVNNSVHQYIARLHPDGSLDTNFVTKATGSILTIALQSDGKILIGGGFSSVNNTNRSCVARLNENGTLDSSFTNLWPIASGSPIVYSIALQANGRILLGGSFTNIAGLPRGNVARLESTGAPDSSFGAGMRGADNWVFSVAPHPDGRILIGGPFDTVNGTNRAGLARLNDDGSLDTGFTWAFDNPSAAVDQISLLTNGQTVIHGSVVWQASITPGVARLTSNGSLDSAFAGGFIPVNDSRALLVQRDSRIIVGGGVAASYVEAGRLEVQGVVRHGVARINTDGSADTDFNSRRIGPRFWVGALAVQRDGKVLVNSGPPSPGYAIAGLARLNHDGSLDTTFPSASLPAPSDLAVRDDGRIVMVGNFYLNRGGSVWQRIAQLLPDGSVDTNFNQGTFFNNSAERVALASDGRIYVTGDFSPGMLRLNENGSVDPSFTVPVFGIDCLAVQADGKIIVGGTFETSSTNAPDHIARLNTNGSLDQSFATNLAGANSYVDCVAVQPDGKVLLGGQFTTVHGVPRSHIARLNSDGSLDTNFLSGFSGASGNVYVVAVRPAGKILIGGNFINVNGVSRNNLAQLNPDGSLDTNFLATSFNSHVFNLALAPNGTIVVGGAFTALGTIGQHYVAVLYGDNPPLSLVPLSPSHLQLCWPAGWTGFTAQQQNQIGSPWADVQQIASNDGTNWSVSLPATNTGQFFRLKR